MSNKSNPQSRGRTTHVVSPEIVRQVYDSPLSLPGKHRWVTKDEDARTIEKLLGSIPEKSIGAPLWVSGDTRNCPMARCRFLRNDKKAAESPIGRSDSQAVDGQG